MLQRCLHTWPIKITIFVFMSSISDQTSFCASLTCKLMCYVCMQCVNHLHLEACFLLMKFSLSSLSISIHQKNIFYQKTNMLKLRKFSTQYRAKLRMLRKRRHYDSMNFLFVSLCCLAQGNMRSS